MDKYFLSALFVFLLGSAANLAHAQENAVPAPLVLRSGLEGGGYWNAGSRLQSVASGMGLAVENLAGTGSLSNLEALLDAGSPVSLVFAQGDALNYYLDENPGAAQSIDILEDIGLECVFLISDSHGDIEAIQDIAAAPRMHVGIKSPKSGIRVTWDYMAKLMPELRDSTIEYGDAVKMITALAHPLTNIDKAVMVVHGPNERSPEIDMVIANPDQYRFVEINDRSLTQNTFNGKAVYQSMKVKPGAVADAKPVNTICVHGLLVANKHKLSTPQRNSLLELIKTHWAEVRLSD